MSTTEKQSELNVTVINKPLPKCDRARPAPVDPGLHYHRLRKVIHLICVAIFFALPLEAWAWAAVCPR